MERVLVLVLVLVLVSFFVLLPRVPSPSVRKDGRSCTARPSTCRLLHSLRSAGSSGKSRQVRAIKPYIIVVLTWYWHGVHG